MKLLDQIRFVLVGTTHPGNIGASARAMKTMGLTIWSHRKSIPVLKPLRGHPERMTCLPEPSFTTAWSQL